MLRNLRHVLSSIAESKVARINQLNVNCLLSNHRTCINLLNIRMKSDENYTSLFKPVPIKATHDDINVGAELTGTSIDKAELLKILNKFSQKREIRMLCLEHGLDRKFLS